VECHCGPAALRWRRPGVAEPDRPSSPANCPPSARAALDPDVARAIGLLLGASGTTDVVDGHVALLCSPGDAVLTSDPEDIGRLLDVRGVQAAIERV